MKDNKVDIFDFVNGDVAMDKDDKPSIDIFECIKNPRDPKNTTCGDYSNQDLILINKAAFYQLLETIRAIEFSCFAEKEAMYSIKGRVESIDARLDAALLELTKLKHREHVTSNKEAIDDIRPKAIRAIREKGVANAKRYREFCVATRGCFKNVIQSVDAYRNKYGIGVRVDIARAIFREVEDAAQ